MAHKHELFIRHVENGKVRLLPFPLQRTFMHDGYFNEAEARDDIINIIDAIAKSNVLTELDDAIVYKVDGSTEYFVSRYYYLWPSLTGESDGKSTSKGYSRRDVSPRRGA